MIYTPLTKKALRLSFAAHKNQVDKGGTPYVYHPFYLAEQMETEAEVCVALLHDVMEDTDMTWEELAAEDFPEEITEALRAITYRKDRPYLDYIREMKNNPLAVKVKMADLRHNNDFTRLNAVDEDAKKRRRRYAAAMEILSS